MRPQRRQVALLAVALVLALFIGLASPTRRYPRVVFQGIDGIGKPGEEIRFGAMLERRDSLGMRRMLPGVRVTFDRDGIPLGGAVTDAEGVASFSMQPLERGTFELEARVLDPDLGGLRARIVVAAMESDDSILVVDVDHALAGTGSLSEALFPLYEDRDPVPGARDSLERLYREHQILYVTHRSARHLEVTRDWLRDHGFPPGPLHSRRGPFLVRERESRKRWLLGIHGRWSRVAAGIGGTRLDAETFLQCGIRPLILAREAGGEALPPGAEGAPTWDGIEVLVGEGS